MRIAFTSDLHTDHDSANQDVWQEMVAMLQALAPDVFICCGDIAADPQRFGVTLMALEHLPCLKLLVPGNHDLWLPNNAWIRRGITSREKYYHLLPALCRAAGVHPLWLAPYIYGDVAFCGTVGWYDYSLRNREFDDQITQDDYRRKTFAGRRWNDARFVHWYTHETVASARTPISDAALTHHMVHELTAQLQSVQHQVRHIVGVTHMLPFPHLLHYRQEPRADYFSAFMGSTLLGEAFQASPPVSLVFAGHTHHKRTLHLPRLSVYTSPVGTVRQWDGLSPRAIAQDRLSILEVPWA